MLHEVGHSQLADHDWNDLTIMGYAAAGTTRPTFLFPDEHAYLRHAFPMSQASPPDLQLHRYALLSALGRTIMPGSQSYGEAPPPACAGAPCNHLQTGNRISVTLTYGNASHAGSGSVPAGSYSMSVEIDPNHAVETASGRWGNNTVTFGGFQVVCTPQCSGHACGGNGCGGSCGTCSAGMTCSAGNCVTPGTDAGRRDAVTPPTDADTVDDVSDDLPIFESDASDPTDASDPSDDLGNVDPGEGGTDLGDAEAIPVDAADQGDAGDDAQEPDAAVGPDDAAMAHDGGSRDAGTGSRPGGCGCRVAGGPTHDAPRGASWLVAAVALSAAVRGRRRSRRSDVR